MKNTHPLFYHEHEDNEDNNSENYLKVSKSTDVSNLILYDYHMEREDNHTLVYYKGPFIDVILSEVSNDIREKLKDTPLIQKKVFSIFLELAQNISYYSAEKNQFGIEEKIHQPGNGSLIIYQTENAFTITSGNMVLSNDANEIVQKCHKINSMNHDELRSYKRKLQGNSLTKKGGGRIGLVDVALKAANPFGVEVVPIDEKYSYLVLSIKVSKY